MRLALVASGSLILLGLAACSNPNGIVGTSATGGTAMGVGSTAPRAASQMPQNTNSLPPGAAVNAPVSSSVGRVGTTAY